MGFIIKEISKSSDIKKFIKFPHKLYKSCKLYVPSLDAEEFTALTKSPSLEYCIIRYWLAYSDKGEIIGRIAGILNPRSNEFHNEKRIRFGWFDFIDDKEVAAALLAKVEEWGRELSMTQIHGPHGYNTWGKQGILVEGFDNMPPINCLYNYEYYPKFMDELGYQKQVDWIQVKLRADEGVPDKLKRINQMLLDKYNLKVLDIKKLKSLDKYADSFFKSYHEGFRNVVNFVPLTDKEQEAIVKEYFSKLRPELTCIIVDEHDDIAAFGICIPNLSKSFRKTKGKLYPFGIFHILREFKKYDTIDLMMVASASEWHNKGISSIYHTFIATNLHRGSIKHAITNPQNEYNLATKVWERYGAEPYMRRRCYIKDI